MILFHRKLVGIAVDRRRRSVNHARPRTFYRTLHRFEKHLSREHVQLGVNAEMLSPARAHAGLGRLVKDRRRPVEHRRPIHFHDVLFDEGEPIVRGESFEVGALDLRRVIVGHAIHADDGVAPLQKALGNRRADEACYAGDNLFFCHRESL